jgi:hypothetical protein
MPGLFGPSAPWTTCDSDFQTVAKIRSNENAHLPDSSVHVATAAMQYWFKDINGNDILHHSIGNSVIAYYYGACAFQDVYNALASAKDANHRGCIS